MYQVNKDNDGISKGALATEKYVTLILNSDDEVTQIFIWKTVAV